MEMWGSTSSPRPPRRSLREHDNWLAGTLASYLAVCALSLTGVFTDGSIGSHSGSIAVFVVAAAQLGISLASPAPWVHRLAVPVGTGGFVGVLDAAGWLTFVSGVLSLAAAALLVMLGRRGSTSLRDHPATLTAVTLAVLTVAAVTVPVMGVAHHRQVVARQAAHEAEQADFRGRPRIATTDLPIDEGEDPGQAYRLCEPELSPRARAVIEGRERELVRLLAGPQQNHVFEFSLNDRDYQEPHYDLMSITQLAELELRSLAAHPGCEPELAKKLRGALDR